MANNHVEQIITQAIKSKREVRFTYRKSGKRSFLIKEALYE